MKKFTFIIIVLLTGSLAFAQSIKPFKGINGPSKDVTRTEISLDNTKAYTNFNDTVLYTAQKATSFYAFIVFNNSTYAKQAGQYYNCPQSIKVEGVVFYAFSNTATATSVTVSMFAAGADSLPTGTALATQTIAIDTFQAHAHRRVMFTSPITTTNPYVITITNTSTASAQAVFLYCSDYTVNDGKSEWLASCQQGTAAWKKTKLFSGGVRNCDMIMFPVVKYDIADASFTMNKTCINNGDIVNFTNTCPAIYKNKMYDYLAMVDSTKYQFGWNFGETLDTVAAIDTFHQYNTAAAYNITLRYLYYGWYFYLNPLRTTSTIDQCVGIENNINPEIGIYPNPAKNNIYIDNAENSVIELYNVLGKMVLRKENASINENFDISNLPEGNYIIRLTKDNNVVTRKINIIR